MPDIQEAAAELRKVFVSSDGIGREWLAVATRASEIFAGKEMPEREERAKALMALWAHRLPVGIKWEDLEHTGMAAWLAVADLAAGWVRPPPERAEAVAPAQPVTVLHRLAKVRDRVQRYIMSDQFHRGQVLAMLDEIEDPSKPSPEISTSAPAPPVNAADAEALGREISRALGWDHLSPDVCGRLSRAVHALLAARTEGLREALEKVRQLIGVPRDKIDLIQVVSIVGAALASSARFPRAPDLDYLK